MIEWTARDWRRELESRSGPLALYVYTPLCGTCQVAKRMLEVAETAMPGMRLFAANINLMPGLAEAFRIESVPCLLLRDRDGKWDKMYRFGAVMDVMARLGTLFGGENG